jgi:hypothetical protein
MYGIGILLVIPVLIPFQGDLESHYSRLTIDEMSAALAIGVLVALPGLFGLLLAVVARTRVGVHEHLGGSFLAMLGLLSSVVFLGVGAHVWVQAHTEFRSWVELRKEVRRGSPQALAELKRHTATPQTSDQALRIAAHLPVEKGREFYIWAAAQNEELKGKAYRAWAKAHPSDPNSRTALLAHADDLLTSTGDRYRVEGIEFLERLPGPDSRVHILENAQDKSPQVRVAVARCIEAWDDTTLVEAALTLAADENRDVAEAGFDAFQDLSDQLPALQVLTGYTVLLRRTPHGEVKMEVISRLRRAAKKRPLPEDAEKVLEELARGKNREVSEHARRALRELWSGKARSLSSSETGPEKEPDRPAKQFPPDDE